jgi:hypothetical protein
VSSAGASDYQFSYGAGFSIDSRGTFETKYILGSYFAYPVVQIATNPSTIASVQIRLTKIVSRLPSLVESADSLLTDAWGSIYSVSPSLVGTSRVPAFWPFPPERPVVTYKDASGSLQVGRYQYVVVYETSDAYGRVVQSAPSSAGEVNLIATGRTDVVVQTPTVLSSTSVQAKRVLYRTTVNGSIFYRLRDVPLNTDIVDGDADSIIEGNTKLLSSLGILEPGNPGLSAGIFTARGRYWIISAESLNTLYFSAITGFDEAPFWNEALSITLPDTGGKITAVAEMDEKIVIFKENAIFVTYGDGPDNLGQGSFPTPQLISQSLGCRDPRSVVLDDAGLFFMSNEGIWLLSRGLQLQYAGAGVEAYNSLFVTGAHNLVDRHQVWFMTREGTTLVWDSFHTRWYVFTPQPTDASMVLSDGRPAFIRKSDGKFLVESKTAWNDDGTPYTLRLRTGFMALTGAQGYQRIKKLLWSGSSSDTITVTLAYNFNPSTTETFTVVPATVGASPLQWNVKPRQQKCESMQITLTVPNITGRVSLSNFGLEAGTKTGATKQAASRRVQGV